jgi:nitroreductase
MTELLKTIRERKSVRTFDGRPLSAADRERLERYIPTIANPFGIPVRFVLLDAKEHGLSSPVVTGTELYAAGKLRRGPMAEIAFGFAFEKFVLYALSLGVGTVWIAGTMDRKGASIAATCGCFANGARRSNMCLRARGTSSTVPRSPTSATAICR